MQPAFSSLAEQCQSAYSSSCCFSPSSLHLPSSFAQDPAAFFQCFDFGPPPPATISHPLPFFPCSSLLLPQMLSSLGCFCPYLPCLLLVPPSLTSWIASLSFSLFNLSPLSGSSAFQWMYVLILFIAYKRLPPNPEHKSSHIFFPPPCISLLLTLQADRKPVCQRIPESSWSSFPLTRPLPHTQLMLLVLDLEWPLHQLQLCPEPPFSCQVLPTWRPCFPPRYIILSVCLSCLCPPFPFGLPSISISHQLGHSGLYTALDLSSSSTLYLQVISTTNINLTAEQLKDPELCSGQSLKVRLISPKTKGQSAGVCKNHADSFHS